MGVFEHFPYVNYHELNLSWILRKLKELEDVIGTQIVDIVARAGVAENAQAIADLSSTVETNAATAHTEAAAAQSAAEAAQTTADTAITNITTVDNKLTPTIIQPTTDTTYFNIKYNYCHYITNRVVHICARIEVKVKPTDTDQVFLRLPAGMNFTSGGLVIPAFKSSGEWSKESESIYCYLSTNTFILHQADIAAGNYVYVDYIGRLA